MQRIQNGDSGPQRLLDELKQGLQIDRNELDTHLMEQPDAYWRVSEAYVLACSRRDEVKFNRDQAAAKLDIQLREQAEESGTKVTEKSIQSQVDMSVIIIELRKQYAQACVQADLLGAMKDAYRDRSSALRELSQLYASNYFTVNTGVRAREDASDRTAKVVDRSRGFGKGAGK